VGDSARTFRKAISALERELGPLRVASLYLTEPLSTISQPDFLNTVVVGRTSLDAATLLARLHALERRFGRERRPEEPVGGPRTLDLDLLFLGRLVRRSRPPLLPHPRLRERRFVLAPLAELEPARTLPPDGRTVSELLEQLPQTPRVRRLDATPGGRTR
jgi:2-amino-4-hydroxy-6-hydroxymethyldihydropteridine diphosphokinase